MIMIFFHKLDSSALSFQVSIMCSTVLNPVPKISAISLAVFFACCRPIIFSNLFHDHRIYLLTWMFKKKIRINLLHQLGLKDFYQLRHINHCSKFSNFTKLNSVILFVCNIALLLSFTIGSSANLHIPSNFPLSLECFEAERVRTNT